MYWAFGAIALVLMVILAVDILKNPALTSLGKALWILAIVFAPLLAWLVYGFWRIRESRL